GSLLFLVAFFPVNAIHNYYQLPLIAPFALWAAVPLYHALADRGRLSRYAQPLALVVLVAFVGAGIRFAFRHYYQIDTAGISIGRFIRAGTGEHDLVIVSFDDTYYLNPRYLYYADRRGWSIRSQWLEPRAIEGLRGQGAGWVVTSDRWPIPEETRRYLDRLTLAGTLDVPGADEQHVYLPRIN